MNLFGVLETAAQRFPDKVAIRFEDLSGARAIAYGELHEQASRFSGILFHAGVRKGDRVAVFLANRPEYPIVTFGAWRIGAVPVLLSSAMKKEKVQEYVENSEARILVTSEDLTAEASTLPGTSLHELFVIGTSPAGGEQSLRSQFQQFKGYDAEPPQKLDLDSNGPALILYTSGTTGEQKGAVLSHGNVSSNIQATQHHTGMESDDVIICFLPLFHCFGQNFVLNTTLLAGATLVLHKRFEVSEILRSLVTNKVTMFFSIPPNYRLLLGLDDISAFDSVRYFFTAADTMPPQIVREWKQKYGRQIWEGWGLTETSPFATYNHDTYYRLGSVGTPIIHVEVRIAPVANIGNIEKEFLPPGEPGEIAVRGPNVFQGYFNDPEATKRVFREGWFLTGDIGKLDEDGYLYIVDRKNDRIKVSGFSVWPREIERFLLEHFAGRLEDVAVVAVPDRERGEMPLAYVVTRDQTLTEIEIAEACRLHLAGYQRLKKVEYVTQIPKTPTGKILKGELRKWQTREDVHHGGP